MIPQRIPKALTDFERLSQIRFSILIFLINTPRKRGNLPGTREKTGVIWKCMNQWSRKAKKLFQMRRNEWRNELSLSAMARLLGGLQGKTETNAETKGTGEAWSVSGPCKQGLSPLLKCFPQCWISREEIQGVVGRGSPWGSPFESTWVCGRQHPQHDLLQFPVCCKAGIQGQPTAWPRGGHTSAGERSNLSASKSALESVY